MVRVVTGDEVEGVPGEDEDHDRQEGVHVDDVGVHGYFRGESVWLSVLQLTEARELDERVPDRVIPATGKHAR